jgi:hypothetical protein
MGFGPLEADCELVLRERVESLGGELKLDGRPGSGTRAIVSIYRQVRICSGVGGPASNVNWIPCPVRIRSRTFTSLDG